MTPAAAEVACRFDELGIEASLARLDEVLLDCPRHALVLSLAWGIAARGDLGGDLVRAAGYARRVVDVHSSVDTRYRLADVLGCIDAPDARAEAIALFRAILVEQSAMHRARLKLARSLYEDGQTDAAVVELQTLATEGWGEEADEARAILEQFERQG